LTLQNRFKNIRAGIRLANKRGFESIADLDKMIDEKVFGRPSASGVTVTTDTAVNFSAWFNGCLQISQTKASLPLIVYKREKDSKRHYTELPLYNVLKRKTNNRLDAFNWKQASSYHQLSWGNSYSYKQRDAGLRIIGLWPLNPEGMRKIFVMEDGSLVYEFHDEKKGITTYTQDEILHIPGFGFEDIQFCHSRVRLSDLD
jgi:HK97 family phage portal protein